MPVVMTVLLLALIASAIPAAAADRVFADNPPVRFYWRKAEGWFWYEPIPEPTKPERPLPEQPARSPTARQTTAPTVFSAAWFRQNLPKYKDLAWDHPTLTNLRAFLWVQRLALDRARQFADMSELATLGDPLLDALSQRPYATFAAHTLDRQAGTAQARLLNELAQRVGLLFFFHSTARICPVIRFPLSNRIGVRRPNCRCRRYLRCISLRLTDSLPPWAKGRCRCQKSSVGYWS